MYGDQLKGRIIDNKVAILNEWDFREMWMEERPEGAFHKANPFVECVQFMTATGGSVIPFIKTEAFSLQDGAVELSTQLKGNAVVLYVIEKA